MDSDEMKPPVGSRRVAWRRVARAFVMAAALGALLLGVGLLTAVFLAPAPALGPSQLTAVADGAQLYNDECAPCHGVDGAGTSNGPSLKAAGFIELVAPKVRVGGGGMSAFADVDSEEQIVAISQYVAQNVADPSTHEATTGEGGDIYRIYCAACHSSAGRGGALAGAENAPHLSDTIGADALVDVIEGPAEMPVFADGALTLRQQAATGLFLQDAVASPPSPGGWGLGYWGPVTEGFFAVFLGLGGLVLLACWPARTGGDVND